MSTAPGYHLTVFMTSQPSDPRPDPFVKGGCIDRSAFYQHIPAPQPTILRQEIDAFRNLTSSTPAPQLQVCPCSPACSAESLITCESCGAHAAQHAQQGHSSPVRVVMPMQPSMLSRVTHHL